VLVGAGRAVDGRAPDPDIFALLPYQLAELLFADPAEGQALLTGGADSPTWRR
jgi:hypothetical protein